MQAGVNLLLQVPKTAKAAIAAEVVLQLPAKHVISSPGSHDTKSDMKRSSYYLTDKWNLLKFIKRSVGSYKMVSSFSRAVNSSPSMKGCPPIHREQT